MFLGKYEIENKEYCGIYYGVQGWGLWYKDTFNPDTKNASILHLIVKGNNYLEKKANLRSLAIDYQHNFNCSWSYGEYAEITDWFYKNGKRYGLLKEFKENCIC